MCTLQKRVAGLCRIFPLIFLAGLVFSPVSAAETTLVSTGSVWRYFDLGMQPPPEWQAPAFDDSSWRRGPGELGFGDGDEATVINRVNTAYFRATFTVTDPSMVTSLFADVWRDDGVIVYINGVEVLRDNMPAVPPTYFTLASAAAPDDGEEPVRGNISPGVLVAGVNTIAAEVHQNISTSSDLTFDLALVADVVNPNQPPTANNQSVVAVQNVPTPIVLSGSDPDGNPLTYVITSSPAHGTLAGTPPNVIYTSAPDYVGSDSFTFKVNDGALDSADATVQIQVLAPPNPPDVASATAECAGEEITVVFDEPLDASSATDVRNYVVADPLGNSVPVLAATLGADQQTVTLSLAAALNPALSYVVQVSSVCDLGGDCLQRQIVPIEFHSEPLTLACGVTVDNLWPPNHELVDVGLSAVSSGTITDVQVFSNEPDSEGDAHFADGVLLVRAQREGKLEGRIYLIVLTAMDDCGNSTVCCTTVAAPHDSSQAALNWVNAQADAAREQCSPDGSAITPYPILQ